MKDKEIKVLEELKKGKTIKEAADAASTLEILVKRWIRLGSEGNEEYVEFYNEYKKIRPNEKIHTKSDKEELVDKCVKLLNEDVHYKEIANRLNIPEFRLKNFYNQGRLGIKPYDKYYKASVDAKNRAIKEKPKQPPKLNTEESFINKRLKELDLKELDFILEDNNTFQIIPNKQRKIRTIKEEIPFEDISKSLEKLKKIKKTEYKIKRQLNKLSIKSLLEYLSDRDQVLYTNKPRKKIVKKIIKDMKFTEMEKFYEGLFEIRPVIIEEEEEEDSHIEEEELKEETDDKRCIICGKPLNPLRKKDKCKNCLRSIHAANTLNELLNSIEPEIPFFKDDLKKLGYHKDKVLDTIWVLLENNLLVEESNNKYSLVKKERLDEFLNKWEEYIEDDGKANITAKLSKDCTICKKTYAISQFGPSLSSEDGYKDYCKNCEKHVNAARSLKTLLNYVNPKQVFTREEVYPNYSETFLLDSTIFLLQEHDLIDTNPDGERLRLKEEEVLDKFLEKYYIEEDEIPIETSPKIEPIIEEEPIETITDEENELQQKMDIVLYYLKEGFTEKEAFNFADLNKSVLITWKNLGRRGKEPYAYFYREYKNLKDIGIIEEEYEFKYTKNRHEIVLNAIKEGKTRKEAAKLAGVSVKDLDKWYSLGKYNKMEPYKAYYEEYQAVRNGIINPHEATDEGKDIKINDDEKKIKEKMDAFTAEIIKAGSVTIAFNNSDINKEEFVNWINLGNSGETFYKNFLDQYLNSLKYVINEEIKALRMKEANKLMIHGYNINEAVEEVNKIDYSKKEKELQEKLIKEGEDLVKGVVIETTVGSPKLEEYGLKFKVSSQNQSNDLVTLVISGKIKKENLISVFEKLKTYEREINKILTNQYEEGHEILIELETENREVGYIKSLLNEF